MAATPPSYSPGRPPNARDLELMLNGMPSFLGILSSASTTNPVDNSTTQTPFNIGMVGSASPLNGTLAGRVLLVQPTLAGLILASTASLASIPKPSTVALQSVIPPVAATEPGVLIQTGERVLITMSSTYGWLQWLSNSASPGSLIVWEMI